MTREQWAEIIGDNDGLTPWDADTINGDGMRVCTMTVHLPEDIIGETDADYLARMGDMAINAARDAAPDYCSPAEWTAEPRDKMRSGTGEVAFIVTRTSNAGPDRLAAEGAARVAAGDADPD